MPSSTSLFPWFAATPLLLFIVASPDVEDRIPSASSRGWRAAQSGQRRPVHPDDRRGAGAPDDETYKLVRWRILQAQRDHPANVRVLMLDRLHACADPVPFRGHRGQLNGILG